MIKYQSIYNKYWYKAGAVCALLLRPEKGGVDSLENLSLHASLTYFPIHQFCVWESWVVRHSGLLMGVEAYGKKGLCGAVFTIWMWFSCPLLPHAPQPPLTHTQTYICQAC